MGRRRAPGGDGPLCHFVEGPLGSGQCPNTKQEAGGLERRGLLTGAALPPLAGVGRALVAVAGCCYRPYLGLLALTPCPQRTLESGPLSFPPQTDRYWVSVVWGGSKGLSA